jgi:hypothetical protein
MTVSCTINKKKHSLKACTQIAIDKIKTADTTNSGISIIAKCCAPKGSFSG